MIVFCMVSFSISCFIPIFESLPHQGFNNIAFVCALSLSVTKMRQHLRFQELVSEVEVFQVYGKASDRWLYLHLPSRCD